MPSCGNPFKPGPHIYQEYYRQWDDKVNSYVN